MIIGIDARSVSAKTCGVSRVISCLLDSLSQLDKDNQYLVYTDQVDSLNLGPNFEVKRTGLSRMNIFSDRPFSRLVRGDGVQVFFSGHSWLPLFLGRKVKKIAMIYDIFSVTDPRFFQKRKLLRPLFRLYFYLITWQTIRQADTVMTISEYCSREIRRVYPFVGPIFVLYLSPGIVKNSTRVAGPRAVDKSYILYVGNFRSYKNVDVLLEGFAKYVEAGGHLDLALAGNDDPSSLKGRIESLGISARIHLFYRPKDEELYGLYANAFILVQPSLYEGFGIPPIEAMSFGVPVIVSDAEALTEVTAGAALVFKRHKADDLAEKIVSLERDDVLRSELVAKGTTNIARFSWGHSASDLKKVFEDLVDSSLSRRTK